MVDKLEELIDQLTYNMFSGEVTKYKITDNDSSYVVHNLEAEIEGDLVIFSDDNNYLKGFILSSIQDIKNDRGVIDIEFKDKIYRIEFIH